MQRFRVVYKIMPWNIPRVTCLFRRVTRDKWDITWHITRERCLTILHHTRDYCGKQSMRHACSTWWEGRLHVISSNIPCVPFFVIWLAVLYMAWYEFYYLRSVLYLFSHIQQSREVQTKSAIRVKQFWVREGLLTKWQDIFGKRQKDSCIPR